MKKIFFSIVAITTMTALSACNGTIVVEINPFDPGKTNPSPTLKLTETKVTTNQQLDSDYKDQNGNDLAKGTYIICDNYNTELNVNVKWKGNLDKLYVTFKGRLTGASKNVLYSTSAQGNSGEGTAVYNLSAGTAPLNIQPSGIIVRPKVKEVRGYTYVKMRGVDPNGYVSNIIETPQLIPVVNCIAN